MWDRVEVQNYSEYEVGVIAQLIPQSGGTPVIIDRDVTVVGRQREHCDLVLEEKSVSKVHCILVKTDGLLFVRDLDSTNGTKVNGQRIMRGALLPGDKLSFANEKYRVYLGPDEPEPVRREQTEVIEIERPTPVAGHARAKG